MLYNKNTIQLATMEKLLNFKTMHETNWFMRFSMTRTLFRWKRMKKHKSNWKLTKSANFNKFWWIQQIFWNFYEFQAWFRRTPGNSGELRWTPVNSGELRWELRFQNKNCENAVTSEGFVAKIKESPGRIFLILATETADFKAFLQYFFESAAPSGFPVSSPESTIEFHRNDQIS